MEDFSNETIDTLALPQYEDAELTPLHPSYLYIIGLNIALVFGFIAVGAGFGFYFIEELRSYWLYITLGYAGLLVATGLLYYISFRNKGFAFRTHDVIYRTGAIGTTTSIIPYSRVQHVAEHESLIARWLGLASVEIFTAGGSGGDITIPGLEKIHAIAIKQLLIGKIENKANEENKVHEFDPAEDISGNETPVENNPADEV
ncbi:PH domain-containing protein [Flavobacterium sp. RHBU_24]|uniref:PH domain-containing protein n=1 Tax=Flavobacterium sp. RHBU_24 TaxID=3391185 RepID=UPI00398508B2